MKRSIVDRLLSGVIEFVGLLLPPDDRRWAAALVAELQAIESAPERIRLAGSGASGLLRIAVDGLVERWTSSVGLLAVAAVSGIVIGCIDISSASRWPLRILLLLVSATIGILRPRTAGICGALVGVGLPLVVVTSGFAGPYAHDRADVWIPFVPALVVSLLGAAVARRAAHAIRQ